MCIRDELCQSDYNVFVNIVDQVYQKSIFDHFGLWYDPSALLVSNQKIKALVRLLEDSFPYTSYFLNTASNSARSMKTITNTCHMIYIPTLPFDMLA